VEDSSNDQKVASTDATVAEQSGDAKAKRDQGADLLMKRANALLVRRYFGAARGVLTRAAATGSPQAIFRLAETYDPLVLSAWKATRTRGDVRKARELYAKAYEGGVMEARNRSEALR
jgi:TPR repeat protein